MDVYDSAGVDLTFIRVDAVAERTGTLARAGECVDFVARAWLNGVSPGSPNCCSSGSLSRFETGHDLRFPFIAASSTPAPRVRILPATAGSGDSRGCAPVPGYTPPAPYRYARYSSPEYRARGRMS